MTLTLLDWEKAFDKVDQSKLVKVLQRLCIPERMVNLVRNIYRYAQFRVVQGQHSSAFHRQESGIRQGCPLSPYLFGIIMTAIFQDIKTELNTPKQLQPIHGINYAEVLYADDTLLFGTHTQTINKLLRQVQVESAKYNLALNFEKCINLTFPCLSPPFWGCPKRTLLRHPLCLGRLQSTVTPNKDPIAPHRDRRTYQFSHANCSLHMPSKYLV